MVKPTKQTVKTWSKLWWYIPWVDYLWRYIYNTKVLFMKNIIKICWLHFRKGIVTKFFKTLW